MSPVQSNLGRVPVCPGPTVPLPPAATLGADFLVLFIFARGPWVDARLPQPEAPPARERAAPPPSLSLSSLSALHGILHSRKEGERESGMLPGEYGLLLDLKRIRPKS